MDGILFSQDAAQKIIDNVKWAQNNDKSASKVNEGSYTNTPVACFELQDIFSIHSTENIARAPAQFLIWGGDYTTGKYVAQPQMDKVWIYDPCGQTNNDLSNGQNVWAVWRGRWEVIYTQQIYYGQAQSDWQEGGTRPADPYVSVKSCDDRKATHVWGDAFNVYLPRTGDNDPQVYGQHDATGYYSAYPGDVVEFTYDINGDAVACGSYLGPQIGTIDLWSGELSKMPYGWRLCDGSNSSPDLRGLFVRCFEYPDANLWTDGNQMGAASDGMGGHKRIGVSSSRGSTQSGTGDTVVKQLEDVESWKGAARDGSTVNDAVVCPPCYVLAYKYRWC